MKKLYIAATLLCFGYILNAQTLGYNDLGALFSKENINGTARYNAMSGAFGALGGDLSAMEINPAGAAVFLKSEFAISLNNRNTKTIAGFYGNNTQFENDFTNLSQVGGVFVFRGYGNSSAWSNIALGFNYSIANDFENLWIAEGNSGYSTFTKGYYDIKNNIENAPDIYTNTDGQYFENFMDGKNGKYSFTFAAQHNDNLYLGAAINTYDIEYYQRTLLEEYNYDNNENNLDASLLQELHTYGNGVSFNFGAILKPNESIRLGLAYQSPVWYNLAEKYVDEDLILTYSDGNKFISYFDGINDYKLRTPSKLTASFAYIFSGNGLVSVDYSLKNYSNVKLSNADFISENQAFKSNMENVGELRIGTEWRFDNFSVRGGYHYENSPYKSSVSSDNLEGFSLGAGYKFRGGKFDLAYQKSGNTAPYNFYPEYNNIDAAELDFDTSTFTATLVLNL
ncbi:MAG: outer membrane protein transport protein [Lutibacter sp.]|nr:outer membrane protein transport protein [Lutibacter sp.]